MSKQNLSATVSTPAIVSGLDEYGPEHVSTATETKVVSFRMRDIDGLEGNRNNVITVRVSCPKKVGSIAERNWSLYGDGTVTVAAFVKSYPKQDGGVTRARASLLWDLNHGFVTVGTVGAKA